MVYSVLYLHLYFKIWNSIVIYACYVRCVYGHAKSSVNPNPFVSVKMYITISLHMYCIKMNGVPHVKDPCAQIYSLLNNWRILLDTLIIFLWQRLDNNCWTVSSETWICMVGLKNGWLPFRFSDYNFHFSGILAILAGVDGSWSNHSEILGLGWFKVVPTPILDLRN